MKKPIKPRILYLLTKFSLRRFEIFDGRKNEPEITRDLDKMPEIPQQSSLRKRMMDLTDKKERRKK